MTSTDLPQESYFSLIGGASTVDQLVEEFYRRMDTLPEARTIRAMHADNLTVTKVILRHYFTEWLGGPTLYSDSRGHPRLRQRHLRFAIGPAERDAWMLCMGGALEAAIADAGLRARIAERMYQLADWVRNDEGNPHDASSRGHEAISPRSS